MVDALAPGDIVMAIDVEGLDSIERAWGRWPPPTIASRSCAACGGRSAPTTRSQSRRDGEVIVLLVHPTPETPGVVYRRIVEAWKHAGTTGELKAASATCREDEPRQAPWPRARRRPQRRQPRRHLHVITPRW